MDAVQLVLLFIIVVLSILLLVLGVQVFFILQDLRKTLKKANHVLDDVEMVSDNLAGPLASISTIMSGAKAGAFLTQLLRGRDSHHEHEHDHHHHHDHD